MRDEWAEDIGGFEVSQEILFGLLGFLGGILGKGILDSISQRRLFDHRLRLEKEYELYGDLWDKLFELRRVVGQRVNPLGNSEDKNSWDELSKHFNAYQICLRKGEPFIAPKVYQPAREILKFVRDIIGNENDIEKFEEARNGRIGIELDEKSDEAFKEIERLFQKTAKGIRRRVSPTWSDWLK